MTQLNKTLIITLIFGILFGGFGAALSLSAINENKSHAAIEKRPTSSVIEATVVQVDKRKDTTRRDGKTVTKYIHTPTYEFIDTNGTTQTIEGNSVTRKSANSPIKIGDKEQVVYDSANPKDSFIDDGEASPIIGYILAGLGVLIAGFGIVRKIRA
jgi:hypothetical protein